MADLTMEGLIDHLKALIARDYSNEVSQIYFGDVGVYPPKAFRNARGEEKLVVALVPNYDRAVPGSRTGMSENRLLGVFVAVMINMTSYFEAMPVEAVGERKLVALTARIRSFLEQDANFDLGGRVVSTKVGDIDYEWMQRGPKAIRAAAIQYEALIDAPRL